MRNVNYTLYWVRLVDKKGVLIYKDTNEYVFDSKKHAEIDVQDTKHRKQKLFGMVLHDESHIQQTPKEEFIKDVMGYASIITGVKMVAIRSSIKDREVVDVRKIIVGICKDMGLLVAQIHKKTGFDRGGIYAQIKACGKLLDTDKDFKITYNSVKKATLEANGIKFSDNGQ